MRGWALGLLKLSRTEFYEMRVGEFWEAMTAYWDEKTTDRRHSGELARGASLRLFNLQLKKGQQIKDPRKFWPMPWDEPEENRVEKMLKLSEEERARRALEFLNRTEE